MLLNLNNKILIGILFGGLIALTDLYIADILGDGLRHVIYIIGTTGIVFFCIVFFTHKKTQVKNMNKPEKGK